MSAREQFNDGCPMVFSDDGCTPEHNPGTNPACQHAPDPEPATAERLARVLYEGQHPQYGPDGFDQAGEWWQAKCRERATLVLQRLALPDPERVAERLYRMNGRAWYGRDLGDWHDPESRIGRNESERDRWRRQAQVIVDA